MSDKLIQVTTGFPSLLAMLGYIAVVCQGKIETIIKTRSTLTWFEEWYVYFEIIYGKSIPRWVDAAEKYGTNDRTLREIYDEKLKRVLATRIEWTLFASFDEDKTYRKEGKWEAYKDKRVILYDNTNIKLHQPSDAENQRNTYSMYYGGNVGKGAVYIQPCGWMGCHEIWQGGVSDSEYMQRGHVFETLNEYLLTCDASDCIPFTRILDKGYRIVTDAWNAGASRTTTHICKKRLTVYGYRNYPYICSRNRSCRKLMWC